MKNWWYWFWYRFWCRVVYKTKRIGNYDKIINRFTGKWEIYRLSALERVGVSFPQEQADLIQELLQDESTVDTQRIILKHINQSMQFDGLAEAIKIMVQKREAGENYMTGLELIGILKRYPPEIRVRLVFDSCLFDFLSDAVYLADDGFLVIDGDGGLYKDEYVTSAKVD